MTLAFNASDRGSNPILAIIFIFLVVVVFCLCLLFLFLSFFSFLSLTVSTIRQLLHLGIKSHKAVDSFDSTNEVFM